MSTRTHSQPENQPAPPRINKRYFQAAMQDRGKIQRELAVEMDLDPSALSLIFSGKRKMQMDEAVSLARLLDLPLKEVFRNAGIEPPRHHAVPLRGWVDAHAEIHFFAERAGGVVDCPIDMPDDAMAFQCRTPMSGLEYLDGWLMFVPPPTTGKTDGYADALNRLSVVKLEGGVTMLGYLKRGYTAGRYSIHMGGSSVQDARVEWAVPVKLAMMAE